jgi:hypothetical protein
MKEIRNDKHSLSLYTKKRALSECWEDIIIDGKFSKEDINKNANQDLKQNTPENRATVYDLINNWPDMNKAQFEKKVNILINEIKAGEYLHPGDILHAADVLFSFCSFNIIPQKKEEIKEIFINVINQYGSEIKTIEHFFELNNRYAGWSYNYDVEEIKEIKNQLSEINDQNFRDNIQLELKNYIDNLDDLFDDFINDLKLVNGTGKYLDFPILSMVNIKRLSRKLKDIFICS